MAQPVTRTLKITYGALVLDWTGDYRIHGKWRASKDPDTAVVEFSVLIQNDVVATLKSTCDAFEAAMRTPRQLLKIEMDGQTWLDLAPGSNTGFDAVPTARKTGEAPDTGLSRLYSCSIKCELPADVYSAGGRRTSAVTVDQDASRRRRLTAMGRVTVVPSGPSTASGQWDATKAAYRASLISAYGSGGTFDTVHEAITPNASDKIADFVLELQEDLFGGTASGVSHPSIRGAVVRFGMSQPAPGDSRPGVKRLTHIVASIECAVDKTVSTDLEGIWKNEIRPWLETQAAAKFGASAVARVSEDPAFDKTGNRISATVVLDAVTGGDGSIRYESTQEVWNALGQVLLPAHAGTPLAKYEFDGLGRRTRTTIETDTRLGTWSVSADGKKFTGGNGGAGVGGQGSAASKGAGGGGVTIGVDVGGGGFFIGSGSESPTPGMNDFGWSGASPSADKGAGGGGNGAGGAAGGANVGQGRYKVLETKRKKRNLWLGNEKQIAVTDCITETLEEWSEPVSATNGRGGDRTVV